MRSILKGHGAKFNLAERISNLFVPHQTYIEPYCLSSAVLLRKSPTPIEIMNDLDASIMNVWQQTRDHPKELAALIADLDYDEDQFLYSLSRSQSSSGITPTHHLHWAAHRIVASRMSRGGIGKEFAVPGAGEHRLRGGLPDNVNAWRTTPEVILKVSERIKNVTLTCQPAMKLLHSYRDAGPDCVIYIDAPYLPSTRVVTEVYRHEMTEADHVEMLQVILGSSASVYVSGYPSDLYDSALSWSLGWSCIRWVVSNSSGQNKVKEPRVECVWSNRPLSQNSP